MGYCTTFDFSSNMEDVIEDIERTSGYGKSSGGNYSEIQWYSWRDHLAEVSTRFPGIIIKIDGVGEEFPDIWKARFLNGNCEVVKAEITFPSFTLGVQ